MAEVPVGPHVAIIPARGGSKRIPRKNVRPFLGVPLLARTIAALQSVSLFDRIVVSTDDGEVAEVATAAGAEVPFRRSPDLADDRTPTIPVVADAICRLGREAVGSEVCCVYPTAVLLRGARLFEALDLLALPETDYVVPIAPFPAPVQRALRLDEGGSCGMIWPENLMVRSQDLEPAFHDAGQFYWGTTEAWLAGRPMFGRRTRAIVLEPAAVQDIDTENDWSVAEQKYHLLDANRGARYAER